MESEAVYALVGYVADVPGHWVEHAVFPEDAGEVVEVSTRAVLSGAGLGNSL